jgi:hypothetical protein
MNDQKENNQTQTENEYQSDNSDDLETIKEKENLDTLGRDISRIKDKKQKKIEELIDRCRDESVPPTVYNITKNICSPASFYEYLKINKELELAYRKKEMGCSGLIESKLVQKALEGDNTCMIFYLKNKHADYKEKLTLAGGLEINDYDHLSDQQLKERVDKYLKKLGTKNR